METPPLAAMLARAGGLRGGRRGRSHLSGRVGPVAVPLSFRLPGVRGAINL